MTVRGIEVEGDVPPALVAIVRARDATLIREIAAGMRWAIQCRGSWLIVDARGDQARDVLGIRRYPREDFPEWPIAE